MMILLKLIVLTFLCVMALKIAMGEDMLLEKLGEYFKEKVDSGQKVYSLFICQWCMSSLQVFTAHAFAYGLGILPFEFSWETVIRWPLVVFGSSILSGFTWNIHETINAIKERNESEVEYYKMNNEK